MVTINAATTAVGKRREAFADITEAKAEAAIAIINADIATLDGAPTNAQVIAIVKRSLQREKQIIRALMRVIEMETGG
jgi:hypothetical protein